MSTLVYPTYEPSTRLPMVVNINVEQRVFEEIELPPDEFYFGDPAAWTFDNLWAIE